MKCNIRLLITLLMCSFAIESFATDWRPLDPGKTVLMTLPQGKVVIELAPQFAPNHVAQFIKLIQKDHYTDSTFYRVIDGFVAQAGPANESKKDDSVALLSIEGDFSTDETWDFSKVQDKDLFAEQTGFKAGFPLAYNPSEQKAWMTHCPGVIAMARGNDPDSASSHFYIPNGQAPRYLDRIMTVFGRVVYGMNHIQSLTRTAVIEGEKSIDSKEHTPIIAMQMMADVDKAQQIIIEVEDTDSTNFIEGLAKRRARPNAFFYKKPPPVLDICQTPVKSRLVKVN